MKQKLLFILFFLGTVLAHSQTFTFENIVYTINSQTATAKVTGWSGSPVGNLKIPSVVRENGIDYTVTAIGKEAFSACESLTAVTIPDSVTLIETYAFYECSNLVSLMFGDSVTSIENSAFAGCTSLFSILLPDTLISIGQSVFYGCTSLTSIEIPDSVTSIETNAFGYCTALALLIIGKSVSSMGIQVFNRCGALNSIICKTITPIEIYPNVFWGVDKSLCSLQVPEASVALYQQAEGWKDFTLITGFASLATDVFDVKKPVLFYPNPFSNSLYVETNTEEPSKVEILDINGRVLLSKIVNKTTEFETGSLSSGMYFVKKASGNSSSVTKVIKK